MADSNLLIAVSVCAAATMGALVLSRVHARYAARARWTPAPETATIAPTLASSALIDELLRTARIAEREGLEALAHPLHRSSDEDVQYALDLVASRADPRIVRGVLMGRSEQPPAQTGTRRGEVWLSSVSAVALAVVCSLWIAAWVVDEALFSRVSGGLFAAWCVCAGVWCFTTALGAKRDDAASEAGRAAGKHELILLAAEALARGDTAESVESILRGPISVARTSASLAEAA